MIHLQISRRTTKLIQNMHIYHSYIIELYTTPISISLWPIYINMYVFKIWYYSKHPRNSWFHESFSQAVELFVDSVAFGALQNTGLNKRTGWLSTWCWMVIIFTVCISPLAKLLWGCLLQDLNQIYRRLGSSHLRHFGKRTVSSKSKKHVVKHNILLHKQFISFDSFNIG